MVEHQVRAVAILSTDGMGDKRRRADSKHLRDRQHDKHQVSGNRHSGNRLLPKTADPIQINQEVKGLKQHRHKHEARGFQQMPDNRAVR